MSRTPRSIAAAIAASAHLAACGSSGGADQTTIDFWFFGDAIEAAGYLDMVAAFEEANPDVDVQATPVASKSDLLAKLTTSFAAGDAPDVFLVNFREYGQFAAEGALRPVQPFVDASEQIDLDTFYDAPVEAFSFDGENLTCLPQNVSSLVVYANLDLFDAADVDVPTAGWDWDDFLAAARAMTDPSADTWGLGTTPNLIRVAPFVWSNGGQIVDDDRAPTALTLDEPAAREALDWFLDLSLVHEVVPPDVQEQSFDSEARFLAGRLGMYLNSRRVTPTMRTITSFEWDVLPLPVAPGGAPVSMLHSDAYCMAADTDVAETAWRLVEFALGVDGQRIVAGSGRTVPSNRTIATSDSFLDGQPPTSAQVFLDNAEIVRATPSTATWARVEDRADDILTEIFHGRIDRATGIERLIAETSDLFDGS